MEKKLKNKTGKKMVAKEVNEGLCGLANAEGKMHVPKSNWNQRANDNEC